MVSRSGAEFETRAPPVAGPLKRWSPILQAPAQEDSGVGRADLRDWERKGSLCATVRKPQCECERVGLTHQMTAVERGDGRRASFRWEVEESPGRVATRPACSGRYPPAPPSQRQRADRQRLRQQRCGRLEALHPSGSKRRNLPVPYHPLYKHMSSLCLSW